MIIPYHPAHVRWALPRVGAALCRGVPASQSPPPEESPLLRRDHGTRAPEQVTGASRSEARGGIVLQVLQGQFYELLIKSKSMINVSAAFNSKNDTNHNSAII